MDESFLGRIQPAASWLAQAAPTYHDGQVSAHGVGVPTRQEVQFKDGQRIWLRRVMLDGAPHMYLRDLGDPAEGARIDLRQHILDVETELPITSTRDVAGYVNLSLKLRYPTLDQFLVAVATKGRPE
jgi:hypothetical protein